MKRKPIKKNIESSFSFNSYFHVSRMLSSAKPPGMVGGYYENMTLKLDWIYLDYFLSTVAIYYTLVDKKSYRKQIEKAFVEMIHLWLSNENFLEDHYKKDAPKKVSSLLDNKYKNRKFLNRYKCIINLCDYIDRIKNDGIKFKEFDENIRSYETYRNTTTVCNTKPYCSIDIQLTYTPSKKSVYSSLKFHTRGLSHLFEQKRNFSIVFYIIHTHIKNCIHYLIKDYDTQIQRLNNILVKDICELKKTDIRFISQFGLKSLSRELSNKYDNIKELELKNKVETSNSKKEILVDGVIYRIFKKSNNLTYYIGKTDNGMSGYSSRVRAHFSSETESKISKAIQALGKDKFEHEIIYQNKISSSELSLIEENFIIEHGTYFKLENYNGYGCNATRGGEGGISKRLKKWENPITYIDFFNSTPPQSMVDFIYRHRDIYLKARRNYCLSILKEKYNLKKFTKLTCHPYINETTNEQGNTFIEFGLKIHFDSLDLGVAIKLDTTRGSRHSKKNLFYWNILKGSLRELSEGNDSEYYSMLDTIYTSFKYDFTEHVLSNAKEYDLVFSSFEECLSTVYKSWRKNGGSYISARN